MAGGASPQEPTTADGGPDALARQSQTAVDSQSRLAQAQALAARTEAWFAAYQRVIAPVAAAPRPAGCKPLCELVVGAPLGHTAVTPQTIAASPP